MPGTLSVRQDELSVSLSVGLMFGMCYLYCSVNKKKIYCSKLNLIVSIFLISTPHCHINRDYLYDRCIQIYPGLDINTALLARQLFWAVGPVWATSTHIILPQLATIFSVHFDKTDHRYSFKLFLSPVLALASRCHN